MCTYPNGDAAAVNVFTAKESGFVLWVLEVVYSSHTSLGINPPMAKSLGRIKNAIKVEQGNLRWFLEFSDKQMPRN